ncbi:TetR/AcrR family transcriptional regulator [Amycolatopsis endophytica]|uniref:TetR/AcrR family transcriptional regulator n=1 Tax=Amycolatopsis endophytica TaxID=860233 RepID=UPI001C54A58C
MEALLAQGVPRADARRNAGPLVVAARETLDEQGLAITTRDIASRAGVGLGTFCRRLPSPDALLTAILLDTIDEMTARAVVLRAVRPAVGLPAGPGVPSRTPSRGDEPAGPACPGSRGDPRPRLARRSVRPGHRHPGRSHDRLACERTTSGAATSGSPWTASAGSRTGHRVTLTSSTRLVSTYLRYG